MKLGVTEEEEEEEEEEEAPGDTTRECAVLPTEVSLVWFAGGSPANASAKPSVSGQDRWRKKSARKAVSSERMHIRASEARFSRRPPPQCTEEQVAQVFTRS